MTKTGRAAKIVCLAMLFNAASILTRPAHAGSGRVVMLPAARVFLVSGLNVELSWKWCDVTGLRPLRVGVTSLRPLARDREITIEISPYRYDLNRIETTVSKTVVLPASEQRTETFMYVPERMVQRSAKIEIFEGGRRLRDLSDDHVQWDSRNHNQTEGFPSILVIDYDMPFRRDQSNRPRRGVTPAGEPAAQPDGGRRLPDMRVIADMFPNERQISFTTPLATEDVLRQLSNWSFIEMNHPADLSADWIGLSGIDLVFVTLADLRNMQDEYPDRWQAVSSWLLSGGNLIVLGAGPDFTRLAEIEHVLDLAPINAEDEMRGWGPQPKLSLRLRHLRGGEEPVGDDEEKRVAPPTVARLADFVHRDAGLGKVVAFNEEDPFPGKRPEWNTLFNTVDNWLWYHRHGLSLNRDNEGFWRFMISGVGLAPVNLFRVLIALFVIVIGPINYLLLRRMGRLSWMLATVPLGALLVTGSLLVYAAVTDGFYVRHRSRSLTHIDQRLGHAATWSRQVYYAGLAPSQGLIFPTDAAVFPFLQAPSYEFQRGRRRLEWRDGQQILARGYLQSRVMSQFLVVRSRPSPLRLDIERAGSAGLQIRNRLGSAIRQLYVCDENLQLHGGAAIDAGATAQLKPQFPQAAHARMTKLIGEHPLQPPPGFDEDSYDDVLSMNRGYYSRYYGRDELLEPSSSTSILERRLARIQRPDKLGPRTYVAVVESCGEVPLGIAGARQQQSLYVVTGAW